jgi:hypothetical protein
MAMDCELLAGNTVSPTTETIRRLCYNKNQGKVPVYRPPPPLMPTPPHWQPDQNPKPDSSRDLTGDVPSGTQDPIVPKSLQDSCSLQHTPKCSSVVVSIMVVSVDRQKNPGSMFLFWVTYLVVCLGMHGLLVD